MQGYVPRDLMQTLTRRLEQFPAVVLLGPRQCGKTTLVQEMGKQHQDFLYLDLERPQDLRRLDDPELFLDANRDRFLCFDEIQRRPDLFPILRGFIDRNRRSTRLLLLGSANPDLLRQSAESLAGRVDYLELSPFLFSEVEPDDLRKLWVRGGFPESFLAENDDESYHWRRTFIRTVVERDIPNLGVRIPAATLLRFLQMIAHYHGQLLNMTAIGNSLGVSAHTVRRYLDLIEGTFHIRLLSPLYRNLGKRLVKTPKAYLRDTGILHALWECETFNDLLGYPGFGASWEGFVLEQVQNAFPLARHSFYRTTTGVEIDLVVEYKRKRIAVEAKASTAPTITKGFRIALDDVEPDEAFVVAPVDRGWTAAPDVRVVSVADLLAALSEL